MTHSRFRMPMIAGQIRQMTCKGATWRLVPIESNRKPKSKPYHAFMLPPYHLIIPAAGLRDLQKMILVQELFSYPPYRSDWPKGHTGIAFLSLLQKLLVTNLVQNDKSSCFRGCKLRRNNCSHVTSFGSRHDSQQDCLAHNKTPSACKHADLHAKSRPLETRPLGD